MGNTVQNINLSDDINSFSAFLFEEELNSIDSSDILQITINSAGGDVFDGQAMAAQIRERQGITITRGRGVVASIATVVLLAGNIVTIENTAMLMIHESWADLAGDADELRATAEVLDKVTATITNIYLDQIEKAGKLLNGSREETRAQLEEMMSAETWFTAQEAFDFGLVDQIVEAGATAETSPTPLQQKANLKRLRAYANVPKSLIQQYSNSNKMVIKEKPDEQEKKTIFSMFAKFFSNLAGGEGAAQAELPEAEPTPPIVQEEKKQEEMDIEKMKELLQSQGYNVELKTETANAEQEAKQAIASLENKLEDAKKKLLAAQSAQLGGSKETANPKTPNNAREAALEEFGKQMGPIFNQIFTQKR